MKARTLVILALVVAILGAFILWVERDLPGSEERAAWADRLFGGLEAEDVIRLEVSQRGEGFVLERRPTAGPAGSAEADAARDETSRDETAAPWWLVEPHDYRADAVRVDPLVQALVGLETERTLETTEVDEEGLGLAEPAAVLRLAARGGDGPWTLSVGERMPLGGERVVRLEGPAGARVHLVSGSFLDQLPEDPGMLRDRRLVPMEAADVQRLVLEEPVEGAERLVLERNPQDEPAGFRLIAPVTDRADRRAAEELARALAALRVQRFLDDPPPLAQLGLEPPEAVVEVTSEEGRVVRLAVGAPTGAPAGSVESGPGEARFGRTGGQVVELQAGDLAVMLERPVLEWRSRVWAGVAAFDVDRLVVRDGETGDDDALVLERQEGVWLRRSGDGDGEELAASPVNDLLYALAEAEGVGLELAAVPPEDGGAVRTFELAGEGFERTLTLGPLRPDGTALGWASDRQPAVVLPTDVLDTLAAALEDVREAEPATDSESTEADAAADGS